MPYIQQTIPPPNKVMTFTLQNFAGGLNNRSDQLADNEALNLLNMEFADETLMEKRRGQKYFDDVAIENYTEIVSPGDNGTSTAIVGDTLTDGSKTWEANSFAGMTVSVGEQEHTIVSNTAVDIVVSEDWDAGTPAVSEYVIHAVTEEFDNDIILIDEYKPHQDENVLIRATEKFLYIEEDILTDLQGRPHGVNHNGSYLFTDGKSLYVYGIFHQENSTYRKIKGDPINDYVLLEVKSPPDGHAQLGAEHVEGVLTVDYEGYEIYYEPCKNEFEDNFKGPNKVPENVQYVLSHNGRIYLAGAEKDDDNVFISDIHNPFYFPVSLPIQLPPTSDEVVGLVVYDNSVVVGRKNDVYAIFGNTNRPDMGVEVFHLRRINTHTGFASQNAVVLAHNYLFFLGSDGNAYALGSTRIDEKQLSTTIISQQIDIEKEPLNLTLDDIKEAVSVFHKDMWYLSVKDKVLVYSYRHRAWTLFDGFNATALYVLDNELIWGNADGRIAAFDAENYLDFGKPYQAFWYSKRFNMDTAVNHKQFREFFVVAHTFPAHNSDINIVFEIDYDDVRDKVVIQNQISVWGKSKWGDRFINRLINESLPFSIGRRGRNISFKITNGYFIHGTVDTAADLEYYIGRSEGVLVWVEDKESYYLYTQGEWKLMETDDLNQRMKIYQINGDYELRGKR